MEIVVGAVSVLAIAFGLAVFAIVKLMFWSGEHDSTYEDDRFWGSQDIDRRTTREMD
jgi:hypothetical protein